MVKEGKKDPNAAKPSRVIRRDQFEPSQENKGVFGNLARAPQQEQADPSQAPKSDLFTKPSPID